MEERSGVPVPYHLEYYFPHFFPLLNWQAESQRWQRKKESYLVLNFNKEPSKRVPINDLMINMNISSNATITR